MIHLRFGQNNLGNYVFLIKLHALKIKVWYFQELSFKRTLTAHLSDVEMPANDIYRMTLVLNYCSFTFRRKIKFWISRIGQKKWKDQFLKNMSSISNWSIDRHKQNESFYYFFLFFSFPLFILRWRQLPFFLFPIDRVVRLLSFLVI